VLRKNGKPDHSHEVEREARDDPVIGCH
jgi:hypothetical protein